MTRVVIEGLTKVFGSLVAVDNLSLEVKDREFVSLLGPSGCGKTTTLNCIAGLENPTKGSIYFDEVRVNGIPPKDRGIGLVFQSYAVFTHMTVYDNLAFGLKIRRLSEPEVRKQVSEMAEFLGLKDVLDTKAGKLSLSGLQKTALGRTLLTRPKVLLLDEPLSNLDAQTRVMMRAELKRLQKEIQQTTIFVTHDQLEAMTLSDRIAIMNLGKLQQYDTPEGVYNHPVNRFVANFVGSPSMNFVNCSLQLAEKRALLKSEGFTLDVSFLGDLFKDYESGAPFTLGIRPEHIEIATEAGREDAVPATVYITEPIGSDTIVDVHVNTIPLRVLAPGTVNLNIGDKVWLRFNRDYLHIFDAETGDALI